MKNRILYISVLSALLLIKPCSAEDLSKNTAHMQAMDKITGRVSVINVPVNGEVLFGSLSIVVRACKTRPVEETPDNFAFVDIADADKNGVQTNVFKGWMISSSPATHALEHPIYDVWLLQCVDEKIDPKTLLSDEQLDKRDELPMQNSQATKRLSASKDKVSEPIEEMEDQSESVRQTRESSEMGTTEFFYDEEDATDDEELPEDSVTEELPQQAENPDMNSAL
ncbi:MAG: DUF2155 domain-containing protein [Alphaproteobacteria bacterium]|nr:DUF2155 domain-containing protein [Alphaproteobacteria bacterium]